MSAPGQAVAEAALGAVGARFRLHGRDVTGGVDCVGLAALALRAGGYVGRVPTGYPLRSGDAEAVAVLLDAGLRRVAERAPNDWLPGDLLLMRSGPGQLHLAIGTAAGLVHADAALRRVVERPGVPPWPILGIWRL